MTMAPFEEIRQRLTLPLIAAPMFLVSGPDLVLASCRAGVIGAFPTANARTSAELATWLTRIHAERPADSGAVAPNLIVHPGNARLGEDLAVLLEQPTEMVITSVGSPAQVVEPLHRAGSLVFADIASVRHAHRAIDAGVDGLILLSAGAGGQTGWANPFAFVRSVREFYDGPVVLAGGISDGIALRAALTLGADLAYMGTKFLATTESLAPDGHKQMVTAATLDDITLTPAFTGLPTSMLTPSIQALGIDPKALQDNDPAIGNLLSQAHITNAWRDLYSAGHSTGGVHDVLTVAELVERTRKEFEPFGRRGC
ncbi:NAD(P)H-dependent flavin oxidoreductase [Nocardia sp. NPDC020380]|uniref:NAD(P)H-dependent flavin oxidoreductase n=1 Tax=Nocardia sp. NPDC020380 TaxID=3364309 RepID=UPI0037A921A8